MVGFERDAIQISQEETNDRLVDEFLQCNEQEYDSNEEMVDYIQYRLNLFGILNRFSNECEQKTCVLLPTICDFFSDKDEYYGHLLSFDLFGQPYSS
jgi:hypothetical protein